MEFNWIFASVSTAPISAAFSFLLQLGTTRLDSISALMFSIWFHFSSQIEWINSNQFAIIELEIEFYFVRFKCAESLQ